jgi:hypothetical protein
MNAQVAAYEKRLEKGARYLEKLEVTGDVGARYQRALRGWLTLLAAYEYETEMLEAASPLALAAGS